MKIKLVAIAKDEGLYLPEWIAYHLMIGISNIHIILNGISDNSELICQRISEKYPVTYEFGDELLDPKKNEFDNYIHPGYLKANPLQSRAYAKAYAQTDPSEYDCLLIVDIDEFLCVSNETLEDTLKQYDDFDVILIKTFIASGAEKPFMPSIRKGILGQKCKLTKCLIRTGLEGLKLTSSHGARPPSLQRSYFSGYGLVDKNLNPDKVWSDHLFVLHHTLKSEIEYISLLARGDNIFNTVDGLKANRHGWRSGIGDELILPDSLISKSQEHYDKLVIDANLTDLIEIQKYFIKERAKRVEKYIERKISSYSKELIDFRKIKQLCSGTHLSNKFNNLSIRKKKEKKGKKHK